MPRKFKTRQPYPSLFIELRKTATTVGEDNSKDCAVKALALVANVEYAVAHKTLKDCGRKDNQGTHVHVIAKAAALLGKRMRRWSYIEMREVMASYPGADQHKVAMGATYITTHHPQRFKKQWAHKVKNPLLIRTSAHIAAVIDGRVIDWTDGRSLRAIEIYEVLPS